MATEALLSEEFSSPDFPHALKDIKDCAISLRLAGEYLCDERILQKIGFRVQDDIQRLKGEIEELKRQFVGKPAHQMSVEREMQPVLAFGRALESPEKALRERCRGGELGRSFWERTWSLVEAVESIKGRIEGKALPQGRDRLLSDGLSLEVEKTALFSFLRKTVFLGLWASLLLFSYLFFTMEGEKEIVQQLDRQRSEIQSKNAAVKRVDEEILRIREKIGLAYGQELSRMDRIDLLYLNLKVHGLQEEKERMLLALTTDALKMKENEARLAALQRRSFLSRLLRQ